MAGLLRPCLLVAIVALAAVGQTGRARAAEPAPIVLSAGYTGEGWTTRGGLDDGRAYLEKIEAALDIDAERTWGWRGVNLRASALYTNGDSISADHVGDLQGVSNIEGDGALRLYEAWVHRTWVGGGGAKVGVIDLNTEFDVNEVGSLFLNSSHGIAPDFSQAGANGPSIFPVTGLGAVVGTPLAAGWTVKAGAFDGLPGDPDRRRRNDFGLSNSDGAVLVLEASRTQDEGPQLAFGFWRHTQWGRDGARTGDPPRAAGAYGLLQAPLGPRGDGQVNGFVRAGVTRNAEIGAYLSAGLTYTGPLLTRGEEQLGIAVGAVRLSGEQRRAQATLGQPLKWGEAHTELTYRAQLTPWATLQPTLQYVRNPGAAPGIRDAWAAGVRVQISGETGLPWRLAQ
jgi:porin